MSRTQPGADSRLAVSKRYGERVEAELIQRIDAIRYVGDSESAHWDAITTTCLEPTAELPTVALPVVGADTPVEIKSAGVVYGQGQRRGRFQLRRVQHERLLEESGVYLFAVVEPNDDRGVIAAKVVPATIVGDLPFSWVDQPERGDAAQLAWSRIFEPAEVGGGSLMRSSETHFCTAIGGRVQGPSEKCAFCEDQEGNDADL